MLSGCPPAPTAPSALCTNYERVATSPVPEGVDLKPTQLRDPTPRGPFRRLIPQDALGGFDPFADLPAADRQQRMV